MDYAFYNKPKRLGVYHDLISLYAQLNLAFFNNAIGASVQWGQSARVSGQKRSIRLGSYDPKDRSITLHPSLDQACVPRLCVERVLYHEMLHQKHPTYYHKGKQVIHSKAFKQDESLFPSGHLADRLIRQLLPRLLTYNPKFFKISD